MYLPFFVLAWCGKDAGWRRKLAPFVLLAAIFPITFSLNRGLWGALTLAAVYAAVRLALNGRTRALQILVASTVVGGMIFVASPLYDTILLRVETPHSNDRRAGTATTVLTTAYDGSPIVGYGTTRKMQGSFSSLAGGETEECHQCAAPPLGTQGFMWRLVLTTGFGGTLLCLSFLALQFLRRARGAIPIHVAGCTVILVSVMCSFVYDSLGSAMFTVMIAVGLMARTDMPAPDMPAPDMPRPGRSRDGQPPGRRLVRLVRRRGRPPALAGAVGRAVRDPVAPPHRPAAPRRLPLPQRTPPAPARARPTCPGPPPCCSGSGRDDRRSRDRSSGGSWSAR